MIRVRGNLKKEIQEAYDKAVLKKKRVVLEALKAATPVDTGEAAAGWYISGNSIENDVSHIEALNNGTSQQAPKHFIERTLLAQGFKPRGTIVRSK